MSQSLSDIAGVLELAGVAAGLFLLHRAAKEGATLLRAAGLVLVIGSALLGLCTGYYWFSYRAAGAFDAERQVSMMGGQMGPAMMGGQMGPAMMGGQMGPGMMGRGHMGGQMGPGTTGGQMGGRPSVAADGG